MTWNVWFAADVMKPPEDGSSPGTAQAADNA